MRQRSSLREPQDSTRSVFPDAQIGTQPAVRSSLPASGVAADGGALARVVGNRAGVVEWANEAFERLSGVALSDTIGKPVARFLERVGLELEVVDFVAQHFSEGRRCCLELPYSHPDGRTIDALLEVDPLFDEDGEIERFTAVVRERGASEGTAAQSHRNVSLADPDSRHAFGSGEDTEPLELAGCVLAAIARVAPARGPRSALAAIDAELVAPCGRVHAASEPLDELIRSLLATAEAAVVADGDAGGVITLVTESLVAGRRYVSKVHPVPANPPALDARRLAVLEVHDTGRTPYEASPTTRDRLVELARRAGARIGFDATPGCGRQALVVFDAA